MVVRLTRVDTDIFPSHLTPPPRYPPLHAPDAPTAPNRHLTSAHRTPESPALLDSIKRNPRSSPSNRPSQIRRRQNFFSNTLKISNQSNARETLSAHASSQHIAHPTTGLSLPSPERAQSTNTPISHTQAHRPSFNRGLSSLSTQRELSNNQQLQHPRPHLYATTRPTYHADEACYSVI